MIEIIVRCPMPRCTVNVKPGPAAQDAMTEYLINAHGLPEVSASYQAALLLPVTTRAA
ncbi:hypothetical protein ABZ958_03200 [Streptomyces sp. NPDC046237]|uniref:hypothetical protein n=1 Tax=Streptomyces sp. NPDC046237 TaxID=3154914 RepID=UPI003401DB52